jgi:peptidoglycan/xylan/chitin deacetylase (PgdA/CDA1 family)
VLHLHWITAVYAAFAGCVFLIPTEYRVLAWGVIAVTYLLLCARASFVQTCTILGPCVTRGSTDGVALTYDDGPGSPGTCKVLDLLAERGVKATFFCIGKHVEQHPEIVERIHAEGHLLGNHSFRHTPGLTIAPLRSLGSDLRRCQDAIERVVGTRPRFYRPPYGLRNQATHYAARRNELEVVGWSAGGLDTTSRSVDTLVDRILRQLSPGSIILLHDHGPDPARTLEITRRVLDEMDARGLRTARLDEILSAAK